MSVDSAGEQATLGEYQTAPPEEQSIEENPFEDVRWTTKSIDDFREIYWKVIAPRLRADGHDPSEHKPTHQWFREQGLRAFIAALRRHHSLTFGEFWRGDGGHYPDDSPFTARRLAGFRHANKKGYECWRHMIDGKNHYVAVHRLAAVAEYGFDEVAGKDIHHRNAIKWDNRPQNLVPEDKVEHCRDHAPIAYSKGGKYENIDK